MSNLIQHAEREFRALGYDQESEDGMNKMMMDCVFELLNVFSKQGHSGFSASHCIGLFEKLARFEPLCPLTGKEEEWVHVWDKLWQNNRCGRVFLDESGQAYDIDGQIFREPNGSTFTNIDSRVPVTFPYTPTSVYVDVPESQ